MKRGRERIAVEVDRDSVAMGDDVQSHRHGIEVPEATRLADLLDAAHPEIEAPGWSWVAVVDGTVSAVWSVDHGVRLLVRNRRLHAGRAPLAIFFRYFVQIDPAWLHERLAAGAPAHRPALEEEFRPIARERLEQEERRREREIREKLLSPETIAALGLFGATIDLHSDRLCRLLLGEETWMVRRLDTMTVVYDGESRGPIASLRPHSAAESWLAAALGGRQRARRGLPTYPAYLAHPGPRLETMASWPPGVSRWSATGEDGSVAQLSGERALAAYRFARDRSLAEVLRDLAAR